MTYMFPYENVFVTGVGLLILVLLVARVVIRKRQQAQEESMERSSLSPKRTDHEPMV